MAMDDIKIAGLKDLFGAKIDFCSSLAGFTSMGVGGPAEALLIPSCAGDIIKAVRWCNANGTEWNVLGGGTNLVVKDSGINDLVIMVTKALGGHETESVNEKYVRLRIGAGSSLPSICSFAADEGLSGLEFAAGIPGSFGGAVRMNAGTRCGCISDVLETISLITPDGEEKTFGKEDIASSYRRTQIRGVKQPGVKNGSVITGASILLTKGSRQDIKDTIKKSMELRKTKQPLGFRNAGCIFRNPENAPPAGKLIEMAGLKGICSGGAKISEIHANFIVNTGDAKAEDILRLMDLVRKEVRDKFSVDLEPEVLIAG